MKHSIFISHYSKDMPIAEIVSSIIQKITLRQITSWYSSDPASNGGLVPGNIWYNEIISRLLSSNAVVVLLTPNSINRPWIYFEGGMGAAQVNCDVVPICIGVKVDEINPPLSMYQLYQLTNYRSLKEFCSKILTKFDIPFDEEMSKSILEKGVRDLSKISFEVETHTSKDEIVSKNLLEELKSHIDKRFVDLLNVQLRTKITDNKGDGKKSSTEVIIVSYNVTIKIDFPEYNEQQFLEVRMTDTVADVYDNIWYLIRSFVKPFTYLQSWILVDPVNNKNLIIREVSSMVPAPSVFKPNIVWHVRKLESEYKGSDSMAKGRMR